MSLLHLVLVLVIAGVVLFFINTYGSFIDGTMKKIINWAVVAFAVLFVLHAFGVFDSLGGIRVEKIR